MVRDEELQSVSYDQRRTQNSAERHSIYFITWVKPVRCEGMAGSQRSVTFGRTRVCGSSWQSWIDFMALQPLDFVQLLASTAR